MANPPVMQPGMGSSRKTPAYVDVAGNINATNRDFDQYANPNPFRVQQAGNEERITQPLYSYLNYPAAGATSFAFFQTSVGGAVTAEDTNMELGAQLPQPQRFLIQGIGIDFLSGVDPVTGPIADSAVGQLNDMWTVFRRGAFRLIIGSKSYLNLAPLMSLPPRSHFDGAVSLSSQTTPAAALQTKAQIAFAAGDVFKPQPMLISPGQNFRAEITFPGGAVPLPSTNATSKIGVILYGQLYRPAQ